jgi:hypothetical protein
MRFAVFDAWDNGACIEEVQPWELDWARAKLQAMTFDEVFAWAIGGAVETEYVSVIEYDAEGNCVREESAQVEIEAQND